MMMMLMWIMMIMILVKTFIPYSTDTQNLEYMNNNDDDDVQMDPDDGENHNQLNTPVPQIPDTWYGCIIDNDCDDDGDFDHEIDYELRIIFSCG